MMHAQKSTGWELPLELAQTKKTEGVMIEGLQTWDDIVTVEEEAALIATMEDLDLAPFRFQQWLGKRLTRSFGWDYDFATGAFGPTDPIPRQFDEVRRRLEVLAGLEPADLAQLLVIRYDAGAGIGWHRDRPVFEQIMGISLGAPAKMRFRQRSGTRFERHSMMLSPRGVYHMRGSARSNWEHSIAAQEETRWSLTFRSLAGASRKRR